MMKIPAILLSSILFVACASQKSVVKPKVEEVHTVVQPVEEPSPLVVQEPAKVEEVSLVEPKDIMRAIGFWVTIAGMATATAMVVVGMFIKRKPILPLEESPQSNDRSTS